MWKTLQTENDATEALAFIGKHLESNVLFYSNIKAAGVKYEGRLYQAEYHGYYQSQQLVGIIGHCWEGTVLLQCPDEAILDSFDAEAIFNRPVAQILGIASQVRSLTRRLPKQQFYCREETLFLKDLSPVIIPDQWSEETIRYQDSDDFEALVKFRVGFETEGLEMQESPKMIQECRESTERLIKERSLFLLHRGDKIVAMCNYNGTAKDIVHLGGMYVPKEERGNRYSMTILGEALIFFKMKKYTKVVLFSQNPAAIKIYQASGFTPINTLILAFNKSLQH